MGLVVIPSLPGRARRAVRRDRSRHLPVRTVACRQVTYQPKRSPSPPVDSLFRTLRRLPLLSAFGYDRREEWLPEDYSTTIDEDGNIAALGGAPEELGNRLANGAARVEPRHRVNPARFLDARVRNVAKIVLGLVPAFLAFWLTKDWWLLAYLGAPLWFAITGLRNVVQSVVGGGGWARSPLLRWNDLVSWERVSDSLLYTGFSVPLLDYLVKKVILADSLGVTTATAPLALYSVMALANGLYIFSHNMFRGLPPAAAFGNLFRAVLSIPIAVGLNAGLGYLAIRLGAAPAAVDAQLQLWAAVISKAASDTVAAVIEGLADRAQNLHQRAIDLEDKLGHLRTAVGQLEVLFPDEDVLERLHRPKSLVHSLRDDHADLLRRIVVNALDLLYFWHYQPRGRTVLRRYLAHAPASDRALFVQSQRILNRKRFISELLIGGLVGKRFERALASYLSLSPSYLRQVERFA
jgi:hypothetical protein